MTLIADIVHDITANPAPVLFLSSPALSSPSGIPIFWRE